MRHLKKLVEESLGLHVGVCWEERAATRHVVQRARVVERVRWNSVARAKARQWVAPAHIAHEHRRP